MQKIVVDTEKIERWKNLNNTYTIPEIAKLEGFGVSEYGIRKLLIENGHQIQSYFERSYHKKFTKKEIKEIHDVYISNSNLSLIEIAKKYKLQVCSLVKRFKSLGLETKSNSIVKHKKVNEEFFENINSEIKAYLLGFFAADGHIEHRKDYSTYCLKVSVHSKDVEILNLFNEYIAYNLCKVRKKGSTMSEIAIHSTKIGKDLLKLGYDNRKTYTANDIPLMEEDCIRHFIRGYFDGDGSIMYGKTKQGYNREMSIVSYKDDILKQIVIYLPNCGNKIHWKYRESISLYVSGKLAQFKSSVKFTINDKATLKLIYEYFYKDANFYLSRKEKKFQQAIN